MGMHIALTHAELINNINIEIQVVVVSVAVRSLPLSLSLSPRGLQILSFLWQQLLLAKTASHSRVTFLLATVLINRYRRYRETAAWLACSNAWIARHCL